MSDAEPSGATNRPLILPRDAEAPEITIQKWASEVILEAVRLPAEQLVVNVDTMKEMCARIQQEFARQLWEEWHGTRYPRHLR
jgi:hypothetical protein